MVERTRWTSLLVTETIRCSCGYAQTILNMENNLTLMMYPVFEYMNISSVVGIISLFYQDCVKRFCIVWENNDSLIEGTYIQNCDVVHTFRYIMKILQKY